MSDIDISSLVPCAVFGATTTTGTTSSSRYDLFPSVFCPNDLIETQALTEARRGRLVGGDAIHDQTHVRWKWVATPTPVAGRRGTLATGGTVILHPVAVRPPRGPNLAIPEARAGCGRSGLFGGQATHGNGLTGEDLAAGSRGTEAARLATVLDQLQSRFGGRIETEARAGGRGCRRTRCRRGGRRGGRRRCTGG